MENLQTSPSMNTILMLMRQTPILEMEKLVDQIIAIRAERVAPHLTADESLLLSLINKCLPAEGDRMHAIIEKRDDETIIAEEWQELAALTDRLEMLHADRLTALAELAKLRDVTLYEIMS